VTSSLPPLALAAIYRRKVAASLARVWENVFDWEHLAHLHDGSFAACDLIERGAWGWRVALTPQPSRDAQIIEMRADRAAGRYVSTTIEGRGAGSEIRVALTPREPHVTDVTVEFHVPEHRADRLAALGDAYRAAYARLWDEDEAMMQARERMLARRRATGTTAPVTLGAEAAVRASLPLLFDFAGEPFRLVDLDGALIAHATTCPHWLGPLDTARVVDGAVRCPWHGYRFDVASGACAGHPGLRLARAPGIRIDAGRVVAEPA